jgi:hypothetical protein
MLPLGTKFIGIIGFMEFAQSGVSLATTVLLLKVITSRRTEQKELRSSVENRSWNILKRQNKGIKLKILNVYIHAASKESNALSK